MIMPNPKIRFIDFTDDWEQRKLGDIGSIKRGKRFTPADYVESDGIPCIHYGQIYTEYGDVATETISQLRPDLRNQLHYASPGNIILAGTSESSDTVCKAVAWMGNTQVAYHDDSFAYSSRADSLFLIGFFQSDSFRAQKASIVYGVTVKRVNSDALAKADIALPSIGEQQKIGALFFAIDNLITLHQRKCDETKELKRYMLQKMFPKNGEKKPEIRFAGFTDAWEQRKLGDIVSLRGRIGFRGYKETDLVSQGNGAITFSPADIDEMGNVSLENNKYLSWEKYDESPEIQVAEGDILFTKTASIGKIGYVKELKEKATINPQFALLTPKDNSDGFFTFLSVRNDDFMKQIRGITGGSSVPTMSQEKLKEICFMAPSLPEQKKIGDYFKSLDKLITLHQRKCDNLKELKKYMLQNMFPTKG